MELAEYKEKVRIIKKRADEQICVVAKEYAFSHNVVSVGDIVTDHIGSIKVEQIKYTMDDIPACVYYGQELKKDKTPKKIQSTRRVHSANMLQHDRQKHETHTILK